MGELIQDVIFETALHMPLAAALEHDQLRLDYAALAARVADTAAAFAALGLAPGARVAVYLNKRADAVCAMFGAAAAGLVFVPVNPLLKAEQLAYIIDDCAVQVLVTSAERLRMLSQPCPSLRTVILSGPAPDVPDMCNVPNESNEPQRAVLSWDAAMQGGRAAAPAAHRRIDADVAAILYTSGSTGKPKGVVLSHRNLVAGAASVASYLAITPADRILAVLPLSFDYGLSQLTTAFRQGACVVLINHLFATDIVKAVSAHAITGLAAVPPLWIQLAALAWPQPSPLRYLTNSGGAMPRATVAALRAALPDADLFLMYGLTEAFRSTYLPPAELARRADSMGRAIPNAEVMVVRPDGTPCAVDEPGELVHRGALVALGYWNDPVKTAERFRPAPGQDSALPRVELAVWSGDTVRRDADGYLYFVGRSDDMIKVSGYRVSPTEVEEALIGAPGIAEVAAFGVPDEQLGQAVVLVVALAGDVGHADADAAAAANGGAAAPTAEALTPAALRALCQRRLPAYMVPRHIELHSGALPRNPNGKIDRKLLQLTFAARTGTPLP